MSRKQMFLLLPLNRQSRILDIGSLKKEAIEAFKNVEITFNNNKRQLQTNNISKAILSQRYLSQKFKQIDHLWHPKSNGYKSTIGSTIPSMKRQKSIDGTI